MLQRSRSREPGRCEQAEHRKALRRCCLRAMELAPLATRTALAKAGAASRRRLTVVRVVAVRIGVNPLVLCHISVDLRVDSLGEGRGVDVAVVREAPTGVGQFAVAGLKSPCMLRKLAHNAMHNMTTEEL